MRKKNERGGVHPAFSNAQQQPHHPKFVPVSGQSAAGRAATPDDQRNRYESLRAPVAGKIAPGNLQQQITPEKNSRDGSRLKGIHVEVAAHGGQSQRNIGSINESDGVHDRRHGDDPYPSLTQHKSRYSTDGLQRTSARLAHV